MLDWGAENYGWAHEEMTWGMALKTIFLYMRESGYKANLTKPAKQRKALWTLSDKEMIDSMKGS